MLVLTRKVNQSVIINDNIKIMVLGLTKEMGSSVVSSIRLGIQAPDDVIVHREEIFNKLYGENNSPVNFKEIKNENAIKAIENLKSKIYYIEQRINNRY